MADHNPTAAQQNIRYLTEAYLRGKLSHAYIIEGSRYAQKEAFADQLAAALLCDRNKEAGQIPPAGDFLLRPCGTCPSCIKAFSGNHPDLIHVTHEKETVLSVREIREQVVADISIKPYYGPYKIYVIRDAGLMNESAQNALLKTIEEPEEYGLILLLTENADAFLQTIRSRCIRISMGDVAKEEMVRALLDEEGEQMMELFLNVPSMNALAINKAAKELEASDRQQALRILQLYLRDLLVSKSTADDGRLYLSAYKDAIRRNAQQISYEGAGRAMTSLDEAAARLKASVKAEAVFESLLLDLRRIQQNCKRN